MPVATRACANRVIVRRRPTLPALVAIALTAATVAARAQGLPQVALVLEIAGASEPALVVHSEIAAGTHLAMAPGARIRLLHYPACSIVTVVGGAFVVTSQGVEAGPGVVESRTPGPCPRVHRLAANGAQPSSGALLMRSLPGMLTLGPDAAVLLAGTRRQDVVAAEILDGQSRQVLAVCAVTGGAVRADDRLAADRSYVLRLRLRDRSDPLDAPFVVSTATDPPMSILRIE